MTTPTEQLDLIRTDMEDLFDTKLPTEEDVKRAYGVSLNLEGERLDQEFEIALGRWNVDLNPPWLASTGEGTAG